MAVEGNRPYPIHSFPVAALAPKRHSLHCSLVAFIRQNLQHTPPDFVPVGSWFFITLCCETRSLNQLCLPPASASLLEDARFYHEQHHWTLHLFLLMPDHLHLIAGFPQGEIMSTVIRNWKRLTARRAGIRWQRNYSDHRLRPEDGLQEKSTYIRQNPVRAGLIEDAEAWPHYINF